MMLPPRTGWQHVVKTPQQEEREHSHGNEYYPAPEPSSIIRE
ncbi:hypothetical protein ACN08Z_00415 [Rothia sp. P7181]